MSKISPIDSVRLVCDEDGFICAVIAEPGQRKITFTVEKARDAGDLAEDAGRGEDAGAPSKLELAAGGRRCLSPDQAEKERAAVPEHFVARLNECADVLSARVYYDPLRSKPFHRVPRGVAIRWEKYVHAGFANLDFCRGVSVRKLSKRPDALQWAGVVRSTGGESENDPGVLLPAETELARRYTHDCFENDPILRTSAGRDPKKLDDPRPEWKPRLTNRGKIGVYSKVEVDSNEMEYFIIVEDTLPTWTCDQIGILLDNWKGEERKFEKVAQTFVYFDRLAKKRRAEILSQALDVLGETNFECAETEMKDKGKIAKTRIEVNCNTFAYAAGTSNNDRVTENWYTGGCFVNHEKGWYTVPVEPVGANDSAVVKGYEEVFFGIPTAELIPFTAPRPSSPSAFFRRVDPVAASASHQNAV